eukprot:110686-Amorphochlora_amoeboformis.AAC.2
MREEKKIEESPAPPNADFSQQKQPANLPMAGFQPNPSPSSQNNGAVNAQAQGQANQARVFNSGLLAWNAHAGPVRE